MTEQAAEAIVTERAPRKAKEAADVAPIKKRTLARLLDRTTSTERGGTPTLRRRKIRLTIDHRICDPGGFEADFDVVLESPSTEVELAAIKMYGTENPGAVPIEMCRMCLLELDGERLSDADLTRGAVWQALGTKGRALLVHKWNELTGGGYDQAALKLATDSQAILV